MGPACQIPLQSRRHRERAPAAPRSARVTVEDPGAVAWPLDLCDQGFDLADALRLDCSRQAEAFESFDHALRRKARPVPGLVRVLAP
jgi:hypothetical protein